MALCALFALVAPAAGCVHGRAEMNDEKPVPSTDGPRTTDGRPLIMKLGTIDCDMVETTPIVFNGRLYRFEYVRKNHWSNKTGDSYFRFIDVETGAATPDFAKGYHLGSAHVEGDTVYVYGVDIWDGSRMQVFWSKNMREWKDKTALEMPGCGMFNNSVCLGRGRYIMAIEFGRPPEMVGERFTIFFAESTDLINWKIMPENYVYSRDRYTACPVIRYLDGWYYMIYLEARPGGTYEPYIVHSRNLAQWEPSSLNPVMRFSPEDKLLANPALTPEQREHITKAVNINNCDVDVCEFKGRTVICYCWGNQQGTEFLAEAEYAGSVANFLKGWFPVEK